MCSRRMRRKGPADDDVVEVSHEKKAVVKHKVAGGAASRTPVIPPITNVTIKPIDHNIGVE